MSTPDKELERQFNLLQKYIGEIGETFGTALSKDSDPYDFTPDQRYSFKSNNWAKSDVKHLFDEVDKENRKSQKHLLKCINTTLKNIKDLQSETDGIEEDTNTSRKLNEILRQEIHFLNPRYAIEDVALPTCMQTMLVSNAVSVDLQINGEITIKSALEVLEDVIPKMLLLREYEAQLNKIQGKLEGLKEKSKIDPDTYNTVYIDALELTKIADQAKVKIQKSDDLRATVTEINRDIEDYYKVHHETFEEHRGNPLVNGFINLVRGLTGILIGILTSPWLFVNYEETMENTKSFFKPRPTESAQIFSFFKQNTDYDELKNQAEMEDIEDINSFIQPLM